MCGRISRDIEMDQLIALFRAGHIPHPDTWDGPRLDWASLAAVQVAPTQAMVTTTLEEPLQWMRWGFCARWFKSVDQHGRPLVNARAETIANKPTFRDAWRAGQRCLVWCSGWYEWQTLATGKQPHHIQLPDRQPFALAGIWEDFQQPDGETIRTVAVLTTAASDDLQALHDRMPFALHPSAYLGWLQGQVRPSPAPDDVFEHFAVTPRMGRADYLEADALMPLADRVSEARSQLELS